MQAKRGIHTQEEKINSISLRLPNKIASFKIITPILLGVLLFAALITPLHGLAPARDLTGTWKSSLPEKYYEMDPSDPSTRMNDVSATYSIEITQSGNSLSIVMNVYETSSVTDPAYLNAYGIPGVPIVGFNQIVLSGTVSSASFTTNEVGASSSTAEHLAGTFTTDIITATLTGNAETTETNGLIVLRSGSSATMPPTVTPSPTPTPAPALPTLGKLGSISIAQGTTWFAATGAPVTTQTPIGAGARIQTGADGIIGFNYPDQGGTVYLGANSDAVWAYIEPQTDTLTGNISYSVVPSPTIDSFSSDSAIDPEEFGQVGVTLPLEIGVGMLILGESLPMALGGAAIVEGSILLGTGIAYIHEQLSPQEGTYDLRPIQVPQGLVMGEGTDYIVTVSNGSTTIQVISGSVIFVDKYTNNSLTIVANQMLALPSGVHTGFSQQDLQDSLSAFDASSINQWWTQIQTTPTSTPSKITTATATPTTNSENGNLNFLSQPMFLTAIILVVIIVIIAVLIATRRKTHSRQHSTCKQNSPKPVNDETPKPISPITEIPPPPSPESENNQQKRAFCPNCGNKLLHPKDFCPFCGSNLRQ